MGAGGDDLDRGQAGFASDFGFQGAEFCPRRHDVREEVFGEGKRGEEAFGPMLRPGVIELAGAGQRFLRARHAGEKEVKRVGDEEQAFGALETPR